MAPKYRSFSFYFIIILFPVLISVLILLSVVFYARFSSLKESRISNQVEKLELMHSEIDFTLENIVSDLIILSEMDPFKSVLNSNSLQSKIEVEQILKLFCAERGTYDQVRFIDETGQEIIRINYNNGDSYIVPEENLQFKGNRYYFQDTFVLEKDNIFFSPLDLNIEGGLVEIPEKPMIRVGLPVFDKSGNKRGIILLNYFGQNIIDIVSGYSQLTGDSYYLLNSDSYWLYSMDPGKNWAFMYDERLELNFKTEKPDIWNEMLFSNTGILEDSDSTFIFITISPMHDHMNTSSGSSSAYGKSSTLNSKDYFWKIVAYLPDNIFRSLAVSIISSMILLISSIFIITVILSILLAKLWYIQKISMYNTRKSLEEKELLLREIHHRIKNSLSLVSSFISLYQGENPGNSRDEFFDALHQKIDTISLVHTYLYKSTDIESINLNFFLKDLLEGMLDNLVVSKGNVILDLDVENIFMPAKPSISIGLIISELAVNSLKHAFPNNESGKISVKMSKKGSDYLLVYSDNGIGLPEVFDINDSDSLGMILIESLTEQLGGTLSIITGLKSIFTIQFPAIK